MTKSIHTTIAKNTLSLYFRMFVVLIISLYTSRIVLKALGITDYGLYNVVAGVIVMFSFINNSLGSSTSRFISYELGKKKYRHVDHIFSSAFFIHGSFAFIVVIAAEFIGVWFVNHVLNIPPERLFACNIVFQLVILSAVSTIILVPYKALIIANERMGIYAFIGIIDATIKLIIAFVVLRYSGDRLILYSVLHVITTFLLVVAYIAYCRHHFTDSCKLTKNVSWDNVKSQLGFTAWSFWGSTAMMLRNHGVNMLYNIFFGPVVNAANAIANQISAAVSNFTSNFTTAMTPQITKNYAGGKLDEMRIILLRGGKFSFFLLLIVCIPVLFETRYLLQLWLTEVPDYTVDLSRLMIMLSLVEVFNPTIASAVKATGRIKWYQIIISLVLLFVVPVSYLMFYLGYKPETAVVVSIILTSIGNIIRLYFLKILLGISPSEYIREVVLRCLLVGIASFVFPVIIANCMQDGLGRLLTICIISTITTALLVLIFGLTSQERSFFMNAVLKYIK